MAKTNFLETSKNLQSDISALIERMTSSQNTIGELLTSAKTAEQALLEKEAQERKEREEIERKKRLEAVLASTEDLAFHVGGTDDEAEFVETPPAPETKPEPAEQPKPAEEPPVPEAPQAEETVKAEPPKTEPPRKEEPQEKRPAPAAGYEAHPIRQETARPQQRPQQGGCQQRPQQSGQRRPQQGGAARPNAQGGFQQRSAQPGRGPVIPAAPAQPAGGKERGSFDPNRGNYTRSYDSDKKGKNKKAIQREAGPDARSWDEDSPKGSRRPKRGKQQAQVRRPEPVVIEKAVITTEMISVKDLSEKIGKPAAEIIKKLFMLEIGRAHV